MSADTQRDEQAIRKLIDDWMEASARGDLAKVLSMMSDDVVFHDAGPRAVRQAGVRGAIRGHEGRTP
jgi:uncharacterized protein (TIGR02246 family)